MKILNKYQIEFLTLLANTNIPKYFYLSGGTALAYKYYTHRISDDLDFFSNQDFDINLIIKTLNDLKNKIGIKEIGRQKKYDRNLFYLTYQDGFELKIEFTKYFTNQFKFEKCKYLPIENKKDIFLDKVASIFDRYEPKDYIDFYYLYQDFHGFYDKFWLYFENKFGYKLSKFGFFSNLIRGKDIDLNVYKNRLLDNIKQSEFNNFFVNIIQASRDEFVEK